MFETAFTPITALIGGVLIGLSAVLFMALHGRIAGATGILAGILMPNSLHERLTRGLFLLGMITAPLAYLLVTGAMPAVQVPVSAGFMVASGVLVGIGVTLANGCTSGHGVCGMARLSLRSIAATMTFMIVTFATVFVLRHVLGA
ncbi:MAG: YeeE/YedE family protein [Neomegalonema sp.]|nr:YeeE/YedE family protein [Neomegalonema sp.]